MHYKKVYSIILLVIMVTTLTACSKTSNTSSNLKEVKVQMVKKESGNKQSQLSGTLQPFQEATVSFEVSGRINSVNAQEGASVNVNDILAAVDSKDYELQLQQAQANVEKSQAALSQTIKGARSQELAEANLKLQQAETDYSQALTDFKRYESLYKSGAISQSDYEKSKNSLSAAKTNRDATNQAYSLTAEGATEEEKQQVNSTYAQAIYVKDQAQLTLSKTSLKSPLKGVVISKSVSQGQLVSAGTAACKIGNIDKLKVTLPVPDYEISSWKTGDKVSVNLYNESIDGQVTNIYSATNESTGSINVEVTIDNEKHNWHPGQVVTCDHKTDSGTAIYVPKEAVISSGSSNPYVFLLKNNKAVKTSVKIGELKNNKLEIKSGINEDENLIIEGADRLSNGDKVKALGSDNK
ncbi:RND transporter [Clostridium carboxidivorans P7]|uniref:Efflux transporter, RND family, MFP subunit n=1 Tax=Clostridium carboxidivorans P7 TaxID=536227 RepID=C6Q1C7_9CLOT|nr:efflux RND transporter periplasmic adaptor subunit [Clostridium carboxidivorans]AKN31523.1 RND transporter [Clostridium carboxidivorans P7]EET84709.1 efflux transporter, RND family, MFP subunit [Clostridium carboxidivorans P7]EFG87074.1 efflux transporter, RND family, MFP subunit [Clostridium carboxidivorans P7]